MANNLENILKCKAAERNLTYTQGADQNSNFFGAYSSNPSEFSFNRGELKLISGLVKHVQKNEESRPIPKTIISSSKKFASTPYGFFFHNMAKFNPIVQQMPLDGTATDERKQILLKNLTKGIISLSKSLPTKCEFSVTSISFLSDSKATIACGFCDEKIRICARESTAGNCHNWVLSNVYKHIKTKHSEKKNHGTKPAPLNVENGSGLSSEKEVETTNNVSSPNFTSKPGVITLEDSTDDDRTIDDGAAALLNNSDDGSDFREDALFTQMTAQKLKMTNTIMVHLESVQSWPTETTKICRVSGDGSCLYRSLAHQLFHAKVHSTEHEMQTTKMRADVVQYIRDNFSSFENILKGRVYEMKNGVAVDMQVECRNFLESELTKASCYGGAESFSAISNMYDVNIVIIDEKSYTLACKFDEKKKRTITVAYRNQNHFDSVIELSEESIVHNAKLMIENEKKKHSFFHNNNTVVELN